MPDGRTLEHHLEQNSDKLESIIRKVDEIADVVGRHEMVMQQIMEGAKRREKLLYGEGTEFGVAQKVQVMWRAWIWILCTLSGFLGFILHSLISRWKL